jgi:two-component system sensor histidine kinase UhpB
MQVTNLKETELQSHEEDTPKTKQKPKEGLISRLLRVPLFIKILVSSSVIVGVGAFFGMWLTEIVTGVHGLKLGWDILFTLVGIILSGLVNYVVLKTALHPLIGLQRTASAVRAGNLEARVKPSPLSDSQMEELSDTFNTMLDTLEERNLQLRRVAALVIGAQEEERKRIARELHDQTAQALTTMLIRLKLLEKADTNEKLREGLAEMRTLISATMHDVRELSRSLRPTLLDDLGLVPALEAYLNGLRERVSEQITFKVCGFERTGRLPDLIELVCYRVVQEAIVNALKHAVAKNLSVELERTPGRLLAIIQDDGCGFDLGENQPDEGLGLLGMNERAQLTGGKVLISSKLGHGTVVYLEIPLTDITFTNPELQDSKQNSKIKGIQV